MESGEQVTLGVQFPDLTQDEVVLTAANVDTSSTPFGTQVFDLPASGDLPARQAGYLYYNTFGQNRSEHDAYVAMRDLAAQGVSELVLDLRYNGGGFLAIASEVGFMTADTALTSTRNGAGRITSTRVFQQAFFNPTISNPASFWGSDGLIPFYSEPQGFSNEARFQFPAV